MNDLDIIKQLEREIGKELQQISLHQVSSSKNGYALDENKNVIGLNLDKNKLLTIPYPLIFLKNLKKLSLYGNEITELPISFGQLKNLNRLWLNENQLKELPLSIGQLQNLKELYLYKNGLENLPNSFGQLQSLSKLEIHNNQLKELPLSMGQLRNSCELCISGNPLEMPPQEIIQKGSTAIINYLNSLARERKSLNEAKILVLGQGGVGKTSLVNRLVFNEFNEHENQTHGINIQNWQININYKKIRLNVWDFGGQEIMHATHQFFLTKRSLYLLILDARQEEQYSRVEYWLKLIETYGADSPVIVVTNKIDQQPLELNEKELLRKYPNIKIFHQVSCKNAKNIDSLKKDIFKHIDQLPHIHDPLPKSWFDVKTKLERMRRDFISYNEYVKICDKQEIDDSSQKTLIDFLHDLGIVLNFRNDKQRPYLKETNILNPEWITQSIYKILNSNQLFQSKGILDLSQLPEILPDDKKYPENKHRFIMDIMEKFQLCFEFPDVKNRFLIPDLLSKQEPDINWDYENSLHFELHYDVLPSSVISRFIVHLHKLASKNTYWRTGIVLKQNDAKALVKADLEEKIIYIYVTGNQRRDLLQNTRVTFENIRRTIAKLVVKEQVPYKNVLIPYQDLVFAEEMDEEYIIYSLKEKVKPKNLLNGIENYRNKGIGQTFNIEITHGDRIQGNKFEKISDANINIDGSNVNQSIQNMTTASEEDLKPLLKQLAEKIEKLAQKNDRQFAQNRLDILKAEIRKPAPVRNKSVLQNAMNVIQGIVGLNTNEH